MRGGWAIKCPAASSIVIPPQSLTAITLADSGPLALTRSVLLVQLGKRVRLCEYGFFDGAARVVTAERPVGQVKRLFKELAADYGIGHVQIIIGDGSDCDAL